MLPPLPTTGRWVQVFERTVYRQGSINRWLTNSLRFMPGGERCATASYDGTVKASGGT
jgi:hypothetical protein